MKTSISSCLKALRTQSINTTAPVQPGQKFKNLDLAQKLAFLQLLHDQHGTLRAWTDADAAKALDALVALNEEQVRRRYAANVRRLRMALEQDHGRVLRPAVRPAAQIPYDEDERDPFEIIPDYFNVRSQESTKDGVGSTSLVQACPVGYPWPARMQHVFVFARLTRHGYDLACPQTVVWMDKQRLLATGELKRVRVDGIVQTCEGAVVPLEFEVESAFDGIEMPEGLLDGAASVDLYEMAWARRDPPPSDVVALEDGRPMAELPPLAVPLDNFWSGELANIIDWDERCELAWSRPFARTGAVDAVAVEL